MEMYWLMYVAVVHAAMVAPAMNFRLVRVPARVPEYPNISESHSETRVL